MKVYVFVGMLRDFAANVTVCKSKQDVEKAWEKHTGIDHPTFLKDKSLLNNRYIGSTIYETNSLRRVR